MLFIGKELQRTTVPIMHSSGQAVKRPAGDESLGRQQNCTLCQQPRQDPIAVFVVVVVVGVGVASFCYSAR